ncbi:MAG: aspartyl/asparaginyl beta-hydroxylase domain-containing protein [Gammaproteobacteria bacterium]|nr:aspartyl/asparaginyl beta-hydroxylase domain-containing protein [Gammaproteobacteria bacterium]MBV9620160.1 aspartyl/asparaginyl beta-hydroxylase domain-containing protein [Gammaproteobacteria bacterium]
MNNVNATATDSATIVRMVQAAKAAGAAGRTAESDQLLARAAQLAPGHPAVLNELGLRMMQRGEAARARELFQRATQADPQHPSLWSNLAASLSQLNLPDEEMAAIERALALEPRHLASLLQKAQLIEARGDARNAALAYRNALATIPPGATPPAEVQPLLERARVVVASDEAALIDALEARLAPLRSAGAASRRADRCIEQLTGRRRRYDPQPTFMYFPELPTIEFFERQDFPWLGAIEAQTDAIREELTAVMVTDRAGLEPYIAYPEGLPLDQWRELNKSRRWSAYFLWNQGVALPAHQARCPRTMAALAAAPRCEVANRAPTAFFSILDAGTHIPPHSGVTNTRLTVHVPLIVPPDCGLRVGSETRGWVPGEGFVFDDTIEHEAWNRSDSPRAVLIFDIWNPLLSAAERELVRAATEAYGAYYGIARGGAL